MSEASVLEAKASDTDTAVPRVISEAEAKQNTGQHLFRLYVIDSDTDPDEPVIKLFWKRGDVYTQIQTRARQVLNGDAAEGDLIYLDDACTIPLEITPDSNWHLAQTRKQKNSKPAGVDKEWLRILIARTDLSETEKLLEIAKYT